MPNVDPRIISLYNEFAHESLPRKDFMAKLTQLAGGAAAAAAILPAIMPDYAQAQQVAEDDSRLDTGYATFSGASGTVRGYSAKPKGDGARPGMVVIHEGRGLNKYIEDVARRFALEGYWAIAPDGLSSGGGTPEDQEAARDLFQAIDTGLIEQDVMAAVPFLAGHGDCTGKVGSVGFCFGGRVALKCAVDVEGLTAAVGFYGRVLQDEEVAQLKVPVMMHYAGDDERVNSGIPGFRAQLDAHNVSYSIHKYPGTLHGFFNDSTAARYVPEAAELAWQRSLAFFEHYLKA